MEGRHSISFISLLSLLLVILQSQTGNLAPTHHLKISVSGRMPTLIVSSSEVGIKPKTEVATKLKNHSEEFDDAELRTARTPTAPTASTTTSAALTTTKWLHKPNQLKTKGKSLKSFYDKKRDKSTVEMTTSTTEQSKNVVLSLASPFVPQNVTTSAAASETTTSPSAKSTNLITTEQRRDELPDIEASKNNEFKTETERTTSLTPVTSAIKRTVASTTSTLDRQVGTVETGTTAAVTGKLPLSSTTSTSTRESNSNLKIMVPLTTPATPRQTPTSTQTSNIIKATTSVENVMLTTPSLPSDLGDADVLFDDNMKATPQAILAKNDLEMKTTSTFAVKLTPSTTPVITVEVNGASGMEGTQMPVTSTATIVKANGVTEVVSHNIRASNREDTTISSSPISAMSTQASVNATILMTQEEKSTESNGKTLTTESTRDAKSSKSHGSANEDKTAETTIVKLIDLEKHETISIDEMETKGLSHLADGGHDGVKQTKKKQLLDKHFIVDATTQLDFETSIETSTLLPVSTVNPSLMHEKPTVAQHSIEKPMFITPTLKPVYNGYLGPIRMDEHTFSVHGAHERPKTHKHETSIESKLLDGRIVEIIAPTALLEQDVTTTQSKATAKDYIATLEPDISYEQPKASMLSTTVFQVKEQQPHATKKPTETPKLKVTSEGLRESKISDIQIEIFDSVEKTYNYNRKQKRHHIERGTTRPPLVLPTTQERFTQYVVDRTEASTPDTIVDANMTFLGVGKPEPAAIEIHINVSEGVSSQGEDLEFSFRQEEKPEDYAMWSLPPSSHNKSNNERNDDILVVEIIDTGDNSTEMQSTNLSELKPVVTFRTESSAETGTRQMADELFMADMKQNVNKALNKPPALPALPPPPRISPNIADSDTIFYISNTEVKVGESPPSSVSDEGHHQDHSRRARVENKFFQGNYVASTHPNAASNAQRSHPKHYYEEDIILSPVRNTADSLKIFRSQDDGSPPLDITYVGESVIEVEQSSGAGNAATTTSAIYTTVPSSSSSSSLLLSSSPLPSQTPDVIIQPAILPEMSIGVPVIGELPPQIELKEIDFMPNEANHGVFETENNDIEENLSASNNDMDRLVESSIQYGGDLIDEGSAGGGGFDNIEGSYPFGNMATMRRRMKNNGAADYAHFTMHHGVNNLRKDMLSVEVANAANVAQGGLGNNNENNPTLQSGNETSASMNITYAIAERIEGNATAFSTSEQTEDVLKRKTAHAFGSFELLFVGGILLLLAVVTLIASYISCHIYKRVHGNAQESESSEMNLPNGIVARCEAGEVESKADESNSTQPPPTPSSSQMKDDYSEHDSTNDRNCLPPEHDDSIDLKKPSNQHSKSLNNVNEKHITDSSLNTKRRTGTETSTRTSRRLDPQECCNSSSVPDPYAGPNGSVTKMTLKNNHLIVETEERNDISRDARETKMHYTSDKDGVFVVEVARGADSKMIPESPIAELSDDHHLFIKQPKLNGNNNKSPTRRYEDEPAVLSNHEQVQIHQPPSELQSSTTAATERSLHQIEEVEEEGLLSPKDETGVEMNFERNTNTGLSQSDLSSTSSGGSNKRYTYGNQELYTIDQAGYASSSTGNMDLTPNKQDSGKLPDDDRTSENGHNSNETPEKNTAEQCEPKYTTQTEPKSDEVFNNEMKLEQEHKQEQEQNQKIEENMVAEIIETECEKENEIQEETKAEIEIENPHFEGTENHNNEDPEAIPNAIDEAKEADNMSVSEVEENADAIESVASDTDTTQKLAQIKTPFSHVQVDYESMAQSETDPEFAYDSLMSLPDPPSMNDEMTQYSDYNGQLDSLPPPPPALLTDENTNMPDIVAEIKSKPCQIQSTINGNIEYCIGNGNSTGHEASEAVLLPPPMILEEINSNGKIVPNSPLTPPESPPPSPPAQFSNGVVVIGMNEQLCVASVHAVAVDVNGS